MYDTCVCMLCVCCELCVCCVCTYLTLTPAPMTTCLLMVTFGPSVAVG